MDILGTVRQQNQVRLRGMEIRIHPSLLALVVLFLIDHLIYPEDPYFSYRIFVVYMGSLIVHELGHFVAALCLGIKIRDINVYPFGAVPSYMRRISPGAEFFVSTAGLIANMALLLAFLPFTDIPALRKSLTPDTFAGTVVIVNTLLVGINLLPLAAMDAGRMLRAILTLWQLSFAQIVLRRVNQMLSIAFLATALIFAHPLLYAAAAIVTISCFKEQLRMQTSDAASGLRVKDAMITLDNLTILPHNLTIAVALPIIVKSMQTYFPIMHSQTLRGVIERDTFLKIAAAGTADDYISTIADTPLPAIHADDDLAATLDEMFRSQTSAATVVNNDNGLCGLLVRNKAVEYVLLKNSIGSASTPEINDEFML